MKLKISTRNRETVIRDGQVSDLFDTDAQKKVMSLGKGFIAKLTGRDHREYTVKVLDK